MQIENYLNFNGQCEEAFKFYAQALGGKAEMMTYENSPMAGQASPDLQKKILHARLVAGNAVLMGSDCPHDHYQPPKGFCVSLSVEDPKEAERLFAALSVDGKIQMPIQQTFWSPKFGMFTDRFGIPWMVNCTSAAQSAAKA
jgi:PhnB protein